MTDKVINNIKLPNGEIYKIGEDCKFGIKGDYSTHYGIEYCQYGLIENTVGTKTIVVKGGMVLCVPGAETKTTIGSDITYNILSNSDVTIFYADGSILEVNKIEYTTEEPDGLDSGMLAWWNPEVGLWKFKSDDTGNVWREGNATPLADIKIEDDVITRIDYIGYRILNDDIYALKGDVATTSLSNLTQEGIDVIKELTGSGFNLFDTKISDHILEGDSAVGWALQGSYVNGAVYPDFYAKCLEEYNEATNTETINGVTVKIHSNGHKFYNISDKTAIDEFFNTIGSAWFYGVDIENERVFLPRNNYFDQLTGDVSQVGDSVEAGLPNITGYVSNNKGEYETVSGAFALGDNKNIYAANGTGSQVRDINFDASLSNPIYDNSDTVQPNAVKKLLYICVGNTIVNEGQIDVSKVLSEAVLRSSLEEIQTVIETYSNGTSWYRIWSDGWCEQGGVCVMNSSWTTYTFLKPYKDINYCIFAQFLHGANTNYSTNATCVAKVSNSQFQTGIYGGQTSWYGNWQASGYIW